MTEEPVRRKHWSNQMPRQIAPDGWDMVVSEFAKALEAEERVQAIVFMCGLDDRLEQLLRTVMIEDESIDKLMDDGQALQPFSIKLRLAYALGLISERVRQDLHLLNRIRNEFAHKASVRLFDDAPVCDLCKNLRAAKEYGETEPREIHRMAVFDNGLYLKYEADRRAKKSSPQRPPVDLADCLIRAKADQEKREPQ